MISKSTNFKAPGPDKMFNAALKHIGAVALELVTKIFNKCFEYRYYPQEWKIAVVIAKPGKDPAMITSYRGIDLLSALNKTFERLILNRMVDHCDSINAFAEVQFGFRKGHSTAHQLQRVVIIIVNARSRDASTSIALLDIENAFVNVWHDGLIYKL